MNMIGPAAGVVPQKSEDGARLLWHGGWRMTALGAIVSATPVGL